MRISLLLLLMLLAMAIGFGLGMYRASAWYLFATCIGFVTVLQLSYVAGSFTATAR